MTHNAPHKTISTSRRFVLCTGILFCLTMALTNLVPVFAAEENANTNVIPNAQVISAGTVKSLQESNKNIILMLSSNDIKDSVKNSIASLTSKEVLDDHPKLPALVVKDVSSSDVESISSINGILSIEAEAFTESQAYTYSEVFDYIGATSIAGEGAHTADYTGAGVTIGIVDAGINDQINTFKDGSNSRIIHQSCFGNNSEVALCNTTPGHEAHLACTTADAGCVHGNAVADMAAGTRTDGTFSSTAVSTGGVAYGSNISFARLTESAVGAMSTIDLTYAMLNFLDDVNNNRSYAPDVINLSVGVDDPAWCTATTSLTTVIHQLTLKGVPVVAASGNDGTTSGKKNQMAYPACLSEVISVGATEFLRNPGPTISGEQVADFSQSASTLDIVAPGKALYMTAPNPSGTSILLANGTSFSAPIVTGSIAVIKEFLADKGFNNYTVEDIRNLLVANGNTVNDPALSSNFSALNLENAINAITTDLTATTTTAPLYSAPVSNSTKNLSIAIETSQPRIMMYDKINLNVKITNTGSVAAGSVVTTIYLGDGSNPIQVTTTEDLSTNNKLVLATPIDGYILRALGAYAESCFGSPVACVRTNLVRTNVITGFIEYERSIVGTEGNYTVTDKITNDGSYDVSNIVVTDGIIGVIATPGTALSVGQSMQFTRVIASIPADRSFPMVVTGTADGLNGRLYDDILVMENSGGTVTTALSSATTKAALSNVANGSLPRTGSQSADLTVSALWILLAGVMLLGIKFPLKKLIRIN